MKRLNLLLSAALVLSIASFVNIAPVIAADEQQALQVSSQTVPEPFSYSVFLPAVSNGGSGAQSPKNDALADLIDSVFNGQAEQVVGVYVADVLGMPVVQQPEGDSNYISSSTNTATQFSAATLFGSTGLLAHNTKAGSQFFNLEIGQEAVLVFGDGNTRSYRIESIRRFQALEPTNPYSDFVDLSDNRTLSANDLFLETYGVNDRLVFQTCIAQDGFNSWGRIFIIAEPL
jgi:hypothetical protein